MKYVVAVSATDWCGYYSTYDIVAETEDEAEQEAQQMLIDEYDLIEYEDGMYGEHEDFDDDGIPLEEDSLTSIHAAVQ